MGGLTFSQKNKAGRSGTGQIVCRGRGGGAARRLRHLQSIQQTGGNYRILRLEYDPTRTSWLALMTDKTGDLHYRRVPEGVQGGNWLDVFDSPRQASEVDSNRYRTAVKARSDNRADGKITLPMKYIPNGTMVHNIEVKPGTGPKYCRSAGTGARVYQAYQEGYVQIKLPSGEERLVPNECLATYGRTSVLDHKQVTLGKAGRRRLKGFRPKVRGVAMNSNAHPHGGGEARKPGRRMPTSPWGGLSLWTPTRSTKKSKRDPLLIKPRPR